MDGFKQVYGYTTFCVLILISGMLASASSARSTAESSMVTQSERVEWGNVSMSSFESGAMVRGGYIPITVTIDPARVPLTVQLFTSTGYVDDRRQTTRRTVRLEENRLHQLTLYHPVWGVSEEVDLYAQQRGTTERIHVGSISWTPNSRGNDESILHIAPLEQRQEIEWSQAHTMRVALENAWTNWKGYTAFDRVVMTYQRSKQLGQSARQALIRWVANGGHLTLVNSPLDRLKKEQPSHLPPLVERADTGYGVRVSEYLFGVISFHRGTQREGPVNLGSWAERFGWAKGDEGYTNPIVSNSLVIEELLEVPIVSGLLILLGFTILIGPVNYWYLRRNGQESRMLLTIPILAILTTGLIFAWDIFKHGLGNDVRAQGVVRIDQRNKQAAFIRRHMLYMAISPGQLSFDSDASVAYLGRRTLPTRQVRSDVSVRHRARSRQLNEEHRVNYTFRGDQQLLGGTPGQSRTPVFLDERNSTPYRGRLVVERQSENQLKVTNTLGFPIHHLMLIDRQNRYYAPTGDHRQTLKTGQEATFEKIDSEASDVNQNMFENWKEFMIDDNTTRDVSFEFASAFRSPPEQMQVTRYMGLTNQNQFGSMGVNSFKEHDSTYLIQGTHWDSETEKEEQ